MTLWHRLSHLLGWNLCKIRSWHDANNDHCVGAACVTCGQINPRTVVNFSEMQRAMLQRVVTEEVRVWTVQDEDVAAMHRRIIDALMATDDDRPPRIMH